jgi:hypothetical protein
MDRQITMPTLKKKWDELLKYSVALSTVLFMVICGVGLLLVVATAVIVAKILWIIK